jgi:hypothetical protein
MVLFIFAAGNVFSQTGRTDDFFQRGAIPIELLRPRREEAPRYPIDTVIGPLGRGQASGEAYEFARRVAAALLEGSLNEPALSTLNRVFIESCINALNVVNPRYFRLGSGREEPDGSVSFLVRFAGRERGITGELYIRFDERLVSVQVPAAMPAPELNQVNQNIDEPQGVIENAETGTEIDSPAQTEVIAQTPPPVHTQIVQRTWIFEDLILEAPRSREEEILESRQRFDFPPYERFF